jgi:hypothetical protein
MITRIVGGEVVEERRVEQVVEARGRRGTAVKRRVLRPVGYSAGKRRCATAVAA